MTYSQLFAVLDAAGLSAERAAEKLGVSHMTLRRWRDRPGGAELPKMYERSFGPVLDQLVAEGKLASDSPAAKGMEAGQAEPFLTTLRRLGFTEDILKAGPGDRAAFAEGLARVGGDVERKREVDRNTKKILSFGTLGTEWKERVTKMVGVVKSAELTLTDKLVAYGALFYLLTPLDLIPDTIPVIGLLDDFAVLGIAIWWYGKRFPKLFKTR